ncbi:MAG TPA: hypothetical protein VLR45_04685, partial [Desulfoprunum sp.]|nr:hypothetical protein [Desulfoprunum sp.]
MRSLLVLLLLLCTATLSTAATGKKVVYSVNGTTYEGYLAGPSPAAPLVLLIHDWDGLTDYEIK